jgi:PAS domain S-box-containing protein
LEGRIVYFNEAAYRTRGYSEDEFQTLNISDLEVPDCPRFFGTKMKELLERGEVTFEAVNQRKDKTVLPVEIHAKVIESDGQKLVMSVARDISERKAALEKIEVEEEKCKVMLNAANVIVQSVNKEGRFVFVNDEWRKLLGYNDEDLKQITFKDVVRPDHLQHCLNVFSQIMNGACVHDVETVFTAKNGFELQLSGNVCSISEGGKVVSSVGFFHDVTERKQNEERLREFSQKIESMNEKLRVVGGLARHDVRNKLSAINNYAYLIRKKHGELPDVLNGINMIEQAVKQSVKIFDFARTYEQIGVEELSYVNVEAKLNEAYSLFPDQKVKLENNCSGLTVLADSLLMQLFYNLIDNTMKYGKETTTITVHFKRTDQENLELVYEDNGVGISNDIKSRLFQEGFSSGGGTGFGLFLIKRLVEVYGWGIKEDGAPGQGARFVMSIKNARKNGQTSYQIESS